MLENIKLAFQGIWGHKMRSFLTMLGIIIGIAAIIAIVSTIQGTNEQIKQNLIGAGNNAVAVQPYRGEYPLQFQYEDVPDNLPMLGEGLRQTITGIEDVTAATLFHKREAGQDVYYHDTPLNGGQIMGIDRYYFDVYGYQIRTGRGFSESDYTENRKVLLLDSLAARTLFSTTDPIGKTLEVKGEPYVVVGVVEAITDFEPVINNIDDYYQYMTRSSGSVFIPDSTWPIVYRYDEPHIVAVRAQTPEQMTMVGKETADVINTTLGLSGEVVYQSEDLLREAQGLQELSNSTNTQLLWIAGISLLVGGIGVMNIMLVSVTERTREIGLKKALGAKRARILWQFLTEAAVLTGLGGLVGVGTGIGLAFVVSRISAVPVAVSPPAIAISVLFSTLIGVLFGLLPAWKASRLNPIEALQQE